MIYDVIIMNDNVINDDVMVSYALPVNTNVWYHI